MPPNNIGNIDIWNLRGKSVPMDKLAPKLIRRASKKDYIAIIIDPKSGILADLKLNSEKTPWERATEKRKENAKKDNENIIDKFTDAYNSLCIDDELPTMNEIATLLGKPYTTVSGWAKKSGYKIDKESGKVVIDIVTTTL